MKRHGNHSQLKDEQHSPERTNNKADLFTLIVTDFKKGDTENTDKIRKGYWQKYRVMKKELEATKRNQEKLENSFTETKAELKSMNDAEEQISDLEVRMMEITQSGEQTASQMKQKLKQYKRHVG